MEREGYLAKKSSGFKARWQRRYFAVRGNYLKYFADEEKQGVRGALDLRELEGAAAAAAAADDKGAEPGSWALTLAFAHASKDLMLLATSKAEADAWLAVFRPFASGAVTAAPNV